MQSIIVYRNPLEAAIWEGMSNGNFFPFIVASFVCVFFVMIYSSIEQKIYRKNNKRNTSNTGVVIVAAISYIGTVYLMWL